MENDIFHYLVEERKQERQKIGGKIFPLVPHFFILPIWEENEEGKMLKDVLYTNTLNLSCIFFFLLSSLGSNVAPLFAFFFGGNNGASNVALFYFYFWAIMFPIVTFFFSWALTLPFFFFFSNIFSFDFLGFGRDSLFLFLLDVIFFGTFFNFYKKFWVIALFCVVICHFF